MHSVADFLDVTLIEPGMPGPLLDEDVAPAISLACTNLPDAQGVAGEAHLVLDRALAAWPLGAERASKARAAYARLDKPARERLIGLARTAHTAAAHMALATAACACGVSAGVEAAHVAAACAQAKRAGHLHTRADTFAAVARLEGAPADDHIRRLAWAVLGEPCSPAASVRAFNAFRGARDMPEVRAARAARLRRIGLLRVARGAELGWLPAWKGGKCTVLMASLSACGVLYAGGEIENDPLAVAHLPMKRVVRIACEAEWAHGFVHGRELFVAQEGCAALWHTPVAEVLAGRTDLAGFEQMPLVAKWGISPRLDAAPAGWVAVRNDDNWKQHMVVDLAARTSRLVDVGQKLPNLGGFAGIAVPRAAWAASTDKYGPINAVFAVSPDGAARRIADEMWGYPTVLPSASRPADLTRAAVLDGRAKFSVCGVRGELTYPMWPAYQSLVRLHRDVFLCWDKNSKAWETARIVVP